MTTPAPDPGDLFMSDIQPLPDAALQVSATIPGSAGGPIEAVKRAMVEGVRKGLNGNALVADGQITVDLDYPVEKEHYPGVWVGFSLSKLERAGLGHEDHALVNGQWTFVQQWMFEGRISLTVAALSSKDRDRIADRLLMMLAFSRPPELGVVYNAPQDTQEERQLIGSLMDNPYVALTPQTGQILCGGEQVTPGTSWSNNVLVYENAFSMDVVGNFGMSFNHDGTYTLRAIQLSPTPSAMGQTYDPAYWRPPILGTTGSVPNTYFPAPNNFPPPV